MSIVVDFEIIDTSNEENVVLLYGVTKDNKRIIARDSSFPLHFLVEFEESVDLDSLKYQINGLMSREGSKECNVIKTEIVEKKLLGEKTKFLKVWVNNVKSLKVISKLVKNIDGVLATYERSINQTKKYLFEKGVTPLSTIRIKGEELTPPPNIDYYIEIESIEKLDDELFDFKILCFDIETYNPNGISDVSKDPVLMISYAFNTGKKGVFTWKKSDKEFVQVFKDEKSMIKAFVDLVNNEKPSFIVSYNGDNFDIPYLKERGKINRVSFNVGWEGSSFNFKRRSVRGNSAGTKGLVHIDLYPFIVTSMGNYLKTDSFTLDAVCEELIGETKEDFDINLLKKLWDKGDIDKPLIYSLRDAQVTLKLAGKVLPLLFELVRIVGVIPFSLCRMGFSKIVENFLMKETRNFNEIILRKPGRDMLNERFRNSFKGGFVYEPKPGFYENIAVFDFRSLYPSIIVAHNICPTTINARGRDVHVSPKIGEESYKFAKKPMGFIPTLVKGLIERRANIKTILKKISKSDKDYNILSARQNAIKLLTNATYGYLGFPQARWYNKGCASSITSWGRQYTTNIIKHAEIAGFKVLYGDTDSVFFILPKSDVNEAMSFVKKVNNSLPNMMELQFEGFFKTGIFVSKKSERKGAKKKYALCNDKNELEIKGFAIVRRDWSKLAKNLQMKVLRKVLINKDFQSALKLLQESIKTISKVPINDFIIKTRLTKDIRSYGNMSPHVSAAIKAEKSGKVIVPGMLIKYIIVKGVGRISDRAYLFSEVIDKGLVPDFDYYINHQLIPSVEEILKVIGFKDDEIIIKEQKTLEGFM